MRASTRLLQLLSLIAIVALGGPAAAFAGRQHDGDHPGDWHHGGGQWHGHPKPPPSPAIRVVASGLEGPFGIDAKGNKVLVAEQGANRISSAKLRNGAVSPIFDPTEASPAGVARVGGGIAFVTSGADAPDAPLAGTSTLFFGQEGGTPQPLTNLLQYELDHNPDGQLQFDPVTHEPLDSLSNPFAVIKAPGKPFVFVADAGGNTVYSVSRSGDPTPFFVPPVINTGACEGQQNNDPEHTGCDPVPTGLALGPCDTLYVSTLTSEVPGEGRVYVLDAHSGEVLRVITGFNGPTGVAVAPNGTVYVSELLEGAPEGDGPPPDGFDPSTIGRIVRVAPNGTRTYAQVTMPVGLDYAGGTLYSSAWSVAGLFLGIPNAGQVVAVSDSAFSATEH